jgi:hypothetical protein
MTKDIGIKPPSLKWASSEVRKRERRARLGIRLDRREEMNGMLLHQREESLA